MTGPKFATVRAGSSTFDSNAYAPQLWRLQRAHDSLNRQRAQNLTPAFSFVNCGRRPLRPFSSASSAGTETRLSSALTRTCAPLARPARARAEPPCRPARRAPAATPSRDRHAGCRSESAAASSAGRRRRVAPAWQKPASTRPAPARSTSLRPERPQGSRRAGSAPAGPRPREEPAREPRRREPLGPDGGSRGRNRTHASEPTYQGPDANGGANRRSVAPPNSKA